MQESTSQNESPRTADETPSARSRSTEGAASTTTGRRRYLQAIGALGVAGTTALSGCLSGGSETGTLQTTVKDAPGDIADFESCVVTIQGIWLKPQAEDDETATEQETDEDGVVNQDGDDVEQSDDREYHAFDDAQTADLVELQDGNSAVVDDREIETGTYAFLQLDVSDVEATLADDGGDAQVDTPGQAPLQFMEPFEIRADERTTFVADFTPVKRGQTERYLLQPVATGTEVRYEDENDA